VGGIKAFLATLLAQLNMVIRANVLHAQQPQQPQHPTPAVEALVHPIQLELVVMPQTIQ